jgi:hypothetical protein
VRGKKRKGNKMEENNEREERMRNLQGLSIEAK